MNIKYHTAEEQLRAEIKELKDKNKLLTNKIARILRYIDACSLSGQLGVPIKDIRKIISSDKMI